MILVLLSMDRIGEVKKIIITKKDRNKKNSNSVYYNINFLIGFLILQSVC